MFYLHFRLPIRYGQGHRYVPFFNRVETREHVEIRARLCLSDVRSIELQCTHIGILRIHKYALLL